MEAFKHYLQTKGYQPNSIRHFTDYTRQFIQWLESKHTLPQYATYTLLMQYIRHLKQAGHRSSYINAQLNGIRHYFDYLQSQSLIPDNPAAGLQLKGVYRRLPHGLLTEAQLTHLYEACPKQSNINQIIVGLLVFQGLRPRELARLQVQDIDADKVFITGDRRTASRSLPLHPQQIPLLHHYMQDRVYLLQKGAKYHVQRISPYLKRHVESLHQIRASRIVHWLKEHSLREVQYLAGHKYLSSTERYEQARPEALQKAIDRFHPLSSS